MERLLWGAIVVVVIVLILGLMWAAWRRRSRRDAAYPVPASAFGAAGSGVAAPVTGLYVATTPRDQPLERLALPGLSYRGKAFVELHEAGVLLRVAGERPVAIPYADIAATRTATVTIDKVVERGGLLVLQWRLGEGVDAADVDSYLRIVDAAERERLVDGITRRLPPAPAPVPSPKEA